MGFSVFFIWVWKIQRNWIGVDVEICLWHVQTRNMRVESLEFAGLKKYMKEKYRIKALERTGWMGELPALFSLFTRQRPNQMQINFVSIWCGVLKGGDRVNSNEQ